MAFSLSLKKKRGNFLISAGSRIHLFRNRGKRMCLGTSRFKFLLLFLFPPFLSAALSDLPRLLAPHPSPTGEKEGNASQRSIPRGFKRDE